MVTTQQPAGLTKAYLELREITSSGGQTTIGAKRDEIRFQFNPKEFSVEKSAQWTFRQSAGSSKAPPAQYNGPNPTSVTLEMFLDASEREDGDVSADVQRLVDACIPTDASETNDRPLPPAVRFGWDKVYFEGYLEKVSARYTLFRSNGKPIRAVCNLTLKEIEQPARRQNPTSGGLSASASVQVVEGDTLPGIAYARYGDPRFWRAIADANGVDDPMRVRPGTRLLIPPATQAAQLA